MKFSMREAHVDDAGFIASLFRLKHARAFLNAPSRALTAAMLDEPDTEGFIIERAGEPVGHFLLSNHGRLIEFCILIAKSPGRGAGTFALHWAMQYALETCGARRISLEIREDNVRTRALCERLGFVADGLNRDGFRDQRTGGYRNLVPYRLGSTRGNARA